MKQYVIHKVSEEKKSLFIKRIDVKGLWDTYDVTWNLRENFNILAGNNGSGKSTILNMVYEVLSKGRLTDFYQSKVNKIVIELSDDSKITNTNFHSTYDELRKAAAKDFFLKQLQNDVENDLGKESERIKHVTIVGSSSTIQNPDGERLHEGSSFEKLSTCLVSSFDIPLPSEEDSSRTKYLHERGIRTNIDLQLYFLQEQYAYYLADLARKVEKHIMGNKRAYREGQFVQNLYKKKNLFFEILNNFFEKSGKSVDKESSSLRFHSLTSDRPLSVYSLSAGEKQIVYIFMTLLLHEENNLVLFMDEPEISLHIDWQKILIEKIHEMNPNCQLIMATHSPSVIIKGWFHAVTELESIKQESRDKWD